MKREGSFNLPGCILPRSLIVVLTILCLGHILVSTNYFDLKIRSICVVSMLNGGKKLCVK